MIKCFKFSLLTLVASLLSACLGGSIAQQIASSIATRVADKAVATALDVDDSVAPKPKEAKLPENTEPDDFWVALTTGEFRPATTATMSEAEENEAEKEVPIQILETNPLVHVQLFNLLIGDEKVAVFQKARALGALNLPKEVEWPSWQVATGMIENEKKMITFLIPPEFGKLPSGSQAVVELAKPGDLNMLRYK